MKKILSIILAIGLLSSCTPVQYVYVSPQDSVVRKQRVVVKADDGRGINQN